jgi:predicted amidohydrolase
MRISIAQTKPIKGDINANIKKHLQFIEKVILLKADAIFFPELSLTGYEAELAKDLASDQSDKRLTVFQQLSDANNITIGVGLPTKSESAINISMVVFQPKMVAQTYSKMLLHSDEFPFFKNGKKQLLFTVAGQKIAPAICYESLQPSHCDAAVVLGAEIYLAAVANSINGINEAIETYPEMARKHAMPILMANFVGDVDTFKCYGHSAVWSKNGKIIAQLNEIQEGLIIYDSQTESTIKHIF